MNIFFSFHYCRQVFFNQNVMTNYEDTDSDDTDILLLIPPNFFSTKAESDAEKFKQNNDTGHLNSHVVKGV